MSELDRALNRQVAALRRWCKEAETELQALDEPARRAAFIDRLEAEQLSGFEPAVPGRLGNFDFPWNAGDDSTPPPCDWPPPRAAGAAQRPGKKSPKRQKKATLTAHQACRSRLASCHGLGETRRFRMPCSSGWRRAQ